MATDLSQFPPISRRREFADILKSDETFARRPLCRADWQSAPPDAGEQINGWFDRLMLQSGLESSPTSLLMLCLLGALAVGGAAFVVRENLLITGIGSLCGGLVPVATAVIVRARRQATILKQMPEMVGELARAARTGRSLEQCIEVVAEHTEAPLGQELQFCRRKLDMGLSVSDAFAELPARTGVVSMSVFTMALIVHHQTGGDLVQVLDRLAGTIRDRISFLGRLKAQTIASRATAVLMLALPPFILAFFAFRDSDYFQKLTESQYGPAALLTAFALQVVGSIWVLRILKNTRRT